jgi:DNA mismatch endonuclease (patch repair protein)
MAGTSTAARTDTLTPAERSQRMGRVRSKNSKAEMVVRRLVHGLGFRYRLHGSGLPGRPDLVFKSRRKVIFVHGCFWHRHEGCKLARLPKSRLDFWGPKLERNRERDREVRSKLRAADWRSLVVWECEISNTDDLASRVKAFLR